MAFPAEVPEFEPAPVIADLFLSGMRLDRLRAAVQKNQVTFPAQVPVFPKHDRPDLQQRLAQLYFVLGWKCQEIGARYSLTHQRVRQILTTWAKRAMETGYLQSVPSVDTFLPRSVPVKVVLTPVLSSVSGSPVDVLTSVPVPPQRLAPDSRPTGKPWQKSYRPRSTYTSDQMTQVLKRFGDGKTAAQIAGEMGISESTIRNWKERCELNLVRWRNAGYRLRTGQGDCRIIS